MDCLIISYSEADRARERSQFLSPGSRSGSDWSRFLHVNYIEHDGDVLLPNHLASLASMHARGEQPARNRANQFDFRQISDYSVWKVPLLGGLYLYQHLLRRGFDVGIVQHAQLEHESLERQLDQGPSVIAISTTLILNPIDIFRLASRCRKRVRDALIVIGGIGVWNIHLANRDDLDRFKPLRGDMVVLDPRGAKTLERIVAARRDGRDPVGIENTVSYTSSRGTVAGPKQPESFDFRSDAMDWDAIDGSLVPGIAQIRTQVSCPFSCSFCSYPVAQGPVITQDMDMMRRELDALERKGVTHLIFVDDTFNVPPKRFALMLDVLKAYEFRWYAFIRCQHLTPQLADAMRDSRCAGVFYGIESANDEILVNMQKKATADRFRRGVELVADRGITSYASFIIGFPGETDETVSDTRAFIEQSGIDYYNTKVFFYEHSTPVHAERERYGLSGQGMEWSHATMDSRRAFAHMENLVQEIKGVPYIPQHSGELWEIAHFDQRGVAPEGIERLYRDFTELVQLNLAEADAEKRRRRQTQAIHELAAYF